MDQQKANELESRLIAFAVRVIKLTGHLPDSPAGKHLARQILRSGTSPAPNYGEFRSAESAADFVHKLSIVLKELNETMIWLKLIIGSGLMKPSTIEDILDENEQLARIISASIRTARTRSLNRKSTLENEQ